MFRNIYVHTNMRLGKGMWKGLGGGKRREKHN